MLSRSAWSLGAALAVASLATSCSTPTASARTGSGALKVVAVENVWGDIVRQIGGSHVAVTSILTDPSADPHSYETDPSAAAAISGAAFVIQNGLGYDEFATKLLSARSANGRTVLTVSTIVGLSGDDANPHLWYSPSYVTTAATAFAAQLTKTDPAHAADYSAGLTTFLQGYAPYVTTLADIRKTFAGTEVGVTERVPGYLVQAAGLRQGTPTSFSQAVEDGSDPSPQDVDAISKALKARSVRVLLYNGQVTSPITDRVKKQAGRDDVPVVALAETLPPDQPDFQTWQLTQAKAVLAALAS